EANGGPGVAEQAGDGSDGGLGRLQENGFDAINIGVVGDSEADRHHHARLGQEVIGVNRLAKLVVGDHDGVVSHGSHGGAAPRDVSDVTFLSAVQLDVVTNSDQTGKGNVE